MNIKRIIKQVLKEQYEKGSYQEIFNADANTVVATQMDKIAKIAIENTDIEEYLLEAAEDCVRLHLLRIDFVLEDEKSSQGVTNDDLEKISEE